MWVTPKFCVTVVTPLLVRALDICPLKIKRDCLTLRIFSLQFNLARHTCHIKLDYFVLSNLACMRNGKTVMY